MFHEEIMSELKDNEMLSSFLQELVTSGRDFQKNVRREVESSFHRSEAKDLLPSFRRASFEKLIAQVADSLGVKQRSVLNQARNSSHREIEIGKFLFVSHQVSSPNDFVRDSNFRKTLAASSQLSFFDSEKSEKTDGNVFGLILHGEIVDTENDISYPFMHLAFPNRELTDYVLKVDLIELFGNVSFNSSNEDVVMIEDNVQPVFIDIAPAKEV